MVNKEAKTPSSRGRGARSPPSSTAHSRRWPRLRGDEPHEPRRHHRRSHRPDSSERRDESTRALVTCQDLDAKRESFTYSVKLGVFVAKIDRILRDRTKFPIPDDSTVVFYNRGVRLNPFSEFEGGFTKLWYRVSDGSKEDTAIKVTQWDERQGWTLDTALRDELAQDIEAGKTVGELRAKIATSLGIDDPNRVVLTAMRGMKNGLIYGDSWEVRQFRKWLCREIAVHVCPDQKYFVFKLLDRNYICHPEQPRDHHTEVAYIKSILTAMMRNVHLTRSSRISPRVNELSVIYGNRIKKSTSRIPWGSTIKFIVSDEIASLFEDDESWLLPTTEVCTVCSDDKKITEMPRQITADCEHKPTICKDCLQQWIQSSMETSEWDRLKCPECPQYLKFDMVRKYASQEVFMRYDKLATRAAVKDIENFRWCLATGCESGQIHNDTCPKFKCHVCKHRHCITHDVPWHSGETCEQYDRRNKQKAKDEKASERVIKATSKKCPKCSKDVHKYTGCNHITCVCRHEWCYLCFAPFQRNAHGFLFCRHKPECTERDPFLEFVEGPQRGGPPRWGFHPPPGGARPPPLFARRNTGNFGAPPFPPAPPPEVRPHLAEPQVEEPDGPNNDIGDNDNRARGPAPPVVPPPPRFAGTPHRVQEEIEFQQRRRELAAMRDAALLGATAAARFAHARRANGPINMNGPPRGFTIDDFLDLAGGRNNGPLMEMMGRFRV